MLARTYIELGSRVWYAFTSSLAQDRLIDIKIFIKLIILKFLFYLYI